mgnify:CR=1 FL=1
MAGLAQNPTIYAGADNPLSFLLLQVFAALKGALDGGLDIPHNEKRFVGYSKDGKELDSEVRHPSRDLGQQNGYLCLLA